MGVAAFAVVHLKFQHSDVGIDVWGRLRGLQPGEQPLGPAAGQSVPVFAGRSAVTAGAVALDDDAAVRVRAPPEGVGTSPMCSSA